MAEKKIQAVVFDLGETLISFGQIKPYRLFKASAHCAYTYLKEKQQPTKSFVSFFLAHLIAIRLRHMLSTITAKDFDSLELLKKTDAKTGVKLTAEQWNRYSWCWYEPLSRYARAEPDIRQTLTKLQQAGLKLGIVSNTFINEYILDRQLELFGILEFFPMRLYSYQFDFRKPDKRIFLEAANRLNIEPQRTLYIGDRMDNDLKGALGAGMQIIIKSAYTNKNKKIDGRIIKIDQISQLPAIIENINAQ